MTGTLPDASRVLPPKAKAARAWLLVRFAATAYNADPLSLFALKVEKNSRR